MMTKRRAFAVLFWMAVIVVAVDQLLRLVGVGEWMRGALSGALSVSYGFMAIDVLHKE